MARRRDTIAERGSGPAPAAPARGAAMTHPRRVLDKMNGGVRP
jgi:hypothetical protein